MKLSLNGEWLLKWADGERGGLPHHRYKDITPDSWLKANVPGEIHLDLMRQGLIEEPSHGVGVLTSRWVEEMFWSYRREFTLPDDIDLDKHTVWLSFGGLDYAARIYLNGQLIGTHENSFTPCRFIVNNALTVGINILTVSVESGLYHVAEKSTAGYYSASDGESDVDELLHKRIRLRKPQSSFGWDWSPRLINVGITGDVSLEWENVARADELVILSEVDGNDTGKVRLRWFTEGISEDCKTLPEQRKFQFGVPVHLRGTEKITADTRPGVFGELQVRVKETGDEFSFPVEIKKGLNPIEAELTLHNVRRWWCVGQGEQHLYTIKATLTVCGRQIAERTKKIGFRTISINQDANPTGGTNYIIELNGRKIFALGADFVPADIIFARIDRKKYEILTDRALEASFNMLRVWGGGLYESDDFYELCDQKGLLVWQEFIFACGAYPVNEAGFMDNVKKEAVHHIRRLASHPSLIVWCGNNEQEWHTWNQRDGVLYPDYALYHMILPRLLNEEDPTRYYQPSSPITPGLLHPNDNHSGDQHPWQVGFANEDFRDYRKMTCRFPNEGGVIGPPSLSSMKASLAKRQEHVNSLSWQIHDNGIEQWYPYSIADHLLKTWTGKDIRSLTIEEYIYLGGLIQGEGLGEYITNFRRRKFNSAAAIFWMYNDCWPVTRSWTIVDCFGNRNPSFHPVRRACQPVTVAVVYEDGSDTVLVYGINDTDEDISANLRYGIAAFDGSERYEENISVTIKAGVSEVIARFPYERWEALGICCSFSFACLYNDDNLIARHRLILPMFTELKLQKPNITVQRENDKLIYRSDVFAMDVCIDLHGDKAICDNFFDLYPGEEYVLSVGEGVSSEILFLLNYFIIT